MTAAEAAEQAYISAARAQQEYDDSQDAEMSVWMDDKALSPELNFLVEANMKYATRRDPASVNGCNCLEDEESPTNRLTKQVFDIAEHMLGNDSADSVLLEVLNAALDDGDDKTGFTTRDNASEQCCFNGENEDLLQRELELNEQLSIIVKRVFQRSDRLFRMINLDRSIRPLVDEQQQVQESIEKLYRDKNRAFGTRR